MLVPVVQVRVVRMPMANRPVIVRMAVRLVRIAVGMLMLVMGIVNMLMGVGRRFVHVLVLMPLGEMQPDADAHQPGGRPKRRTGLLA